MYTRCPKCSTCFRVTERHLSIAKGKVRCGQCQLIFNATEHAIDDLPLNSLNPQTSNKTAPSITTDNKKAELKKPRTPIQKNKIKKPVKPAKAKIPEDSTVKKPVAAPVFNSDATLIADINDLNKDKVLFNDNFDLDAAIDELTHATEDEIIVVAEASTPVPEPEPEKYIPTENKSDDVFETDAYAETNASSVTDIINEMEGQLSLNITKPDNDKKYDANNEFDFIELDNEIENSVQEIIETNDETLKKHFNFEEFDLNEKLDNEPEDDIPEKVKENIIDEDELFDQIDLSDFQDSEIEENIVSENISQDSHETEVPFQLRGDIERLQAPTQRRFHPLLSFSFILVLLALSFSQLAYFRAHEVVNLIPATAPYLQAYCEKVNCHYSGPRNTKQIQLLSRDVRQHPKEKKALLISVAMINSAHFRQPYPNIHIRLSDISGNVVAERVFTAKTYMGKLSNPFLLMKSKTPVHINFEVVDPGVYPINFEFTFL